MRLMIIVALCAIGALVSAPAPAQVLWSEDFESYSNGQALDVGTNPNGWAGGPVYTHRYSWFGNRTVTPGPPSPVPVVEEYAGYGLQGMGGRGGDSSAGARCRLRQPSALQQKLKQTRNSGPGSMPSGTPRGLRWYRAL